MDNLPIDIPWVLGLCVHGLGVIGLGVLGLGMLGLCVWEC